MKQFITILGFELKSYFKNKIFIGVTILLVIVSAGVMFFPALSEMLGGGGFGNRPGNAGTVFFRGLQRISGAGHR